MLAPLVGEDRSCGEDLSRKVGYSTDITPRILLYNRYDCGIFAVYNADCLVFEESPSVEEANGVQLRYNHPVRLRILEIQRKMERHLV